MHLKMSSAKRRAFCLGLSVLKWRHNEHLYVQRNKQIKYEGAWEFLM